VIPLLLVGACLAVGAAARWALAARRFTKGIEALRHRLVAAQGPAQDDPALPARLRAFAVRNGGRSDGPQAVRVEMQLKPGAGFFPLTATQINGTRQPGFVWEAWGRTARLFPLRIVDA
jgi:hypothetical protein